MERDHQKKKLQPIQNTAASYIEDNIWDVIVHHKSYQQWKCESHHLLGGDHIHLLHKGNLRHTSEITLSPMLFFFYYTLTMLNSIRGHMVLLCPLHVQLNVTVHFSKARIMEKK